MISMVTAYCFSMINHFFCTLRMQDLGWTNCQLACGEYPYLATVIAQSGITPTCTPNIGITTR